MKEQIDITRTQEEDRATEMSRRSNRSDSSSIIERIDNMDTPASNEKGKTTRQPYDGSKKPNVYPKSLLTLNQVNGGLDRLEKRIQWIKSDVTRLKSSFDEATDNMAKLKIIEDDRVLREEVSTLGDKRKELLEKQKDLLAARLNEIDTYQIDDIDW